MASVNNSPLGRNADYLEKEIISSYIDGNYSIPELSQKFSINKSRVRNILLSKNALRSRSDAIKLAAIKGKLGSGVRGKKRVFTDEWKNNIRKAKLRYGEENSLGVSLKPSGYIEITRGSNKGKLEHILIIEKRIGRKILMDEVVHHIDGDKTNNNENNLALMTRSGHARLHRHEDKISGKIIKRKQNGCFS